MNKFLLKACILFFLTGISLSEVLASEPLLSGDLNRVVVFARYNGEPDFEEAKSFYNDFFNGSTENSLRTYFKSISNNKLSVNSIIFPKSIESKSYELKYCFHCYDVNWAKDFPSCKGKDISAGLQDVSIGFVIKELAEKVDAEIDETVIDKDGDGYVDNFVVYLRGGGRGKGKGIHSPHNGEISERFTTTNGVIMVKGKIVKKYTIVYERNSLATHSRFLLNHLGFSNLYRNRTLYPRPVGVWDPMDGPELTYPLVYNRFKYSNKSWISDIPLIESNKSYTLNSSDKSTNTAYKIATENPNEFLVLEYRNKNASYSEHLPESGLLIYRINSNQNGSLAEIPEFYVFRKDGTVSKNGDIFSAAFSGTNGRNIFNSTTNPAPFLSNGNSVQIEISDISTLGEILTFKTGNLPVSNIQTSMYNEEMLYSISSPGMINIYGNWERITIFNLGGIKSFSKKSDNFNSPTPIDLRHLEKGVYILELSKFDKCKRVKIILN